MSTFTYEITDRTTGQVLRTQTGVLAPVTAATAAATLSTAGVLTLISTANLHPGMAVFVKGAPEGAYIHSIISSTSAQLYYPKFTPGSGATVDLWERVAVTLGAELTGLTVICTGFNPFPMPVRYATGNWRNNHTTHGHGTNYVASSNTAVDQGYGNGVTVLPVGTSAASGIYQPTSYTVSTSDNIGQLPHRHRAEWHSVWEFVCSGGARSSVTAKNTDVNYISTEA